MKKISSGVAIVAGIYLFLGIPGLFLAFIGGVSGSNAEGLRDVLVDLGMRVLFIGIPIALLASGVGLLLMKRFGHISAIVTATMLAIALSVYGAFGLVDQSSPALSFSNFCFIGALVFVLLTFYLTRPNVKTLFK